MEQSRFNKGLELLSQIDGDVVIMSSKAYKIFVQI